MKSNDSSTLHSTHITLNSQHPLFYDDTFCAILKLLKFIHYNLEVARL